MRVKGITLAFFAVTDIMNMKDQKWKRFVASADTTRLLPAIRAVRDTVDFVVVSYHGGGEYANRATARTRGFARDVLDGGADLFLGHHPHVPYGIDRVGGRIAVYSLGNFVFRQPDRYWTRYSYAMAFGIDRDSSGTRVGALRALPVRAGFQPEFLSGGEDAHRILERLRLLSTQEVTEHMTW